MMDKFRFQLKEDTQYNFLKYKLAKSFEKLLFWKMETGLLSRNGNVEQERGTGKFFHSSMMNLYQTVRCTYLLIKLFSVIV